MVECELRRTQLFIARGVSFNRYMVECESVYHMSTFVDNKVLIDTWWNVNYVSFQLYLPRIGF